MIRRLQIVEASIAFVIGTERQTVGNAHLHGQSGHQSHRRTFRNVGRDRAAPRRESFGDIDLMKGRVFLCGEMTT